MKTYAHARTCAHMFVTVLFIIDKYPDCCLLWYLDILKFRYLERMVKVWYTHTIAYYLAIKKNNLLIHATICMDLQRSMLNEKLQILINYLLNDSISIHLIIPKLQKWRTDQWCSGLRIREGKWIGVKKKGGQQEGSLLS